MTRVALDGGGEMTVPLARTHAEGAAVTLVVRAEDVLIAMEAPRGISARNVFAADVVDCVRGGSDVTLRCTLVDGSLALLVRLTPSAVTTLGIDVGRRVWLAIKRHSIRPT